MVWRESSWAAHYQSPLPASDTLFTEALGPDSPGRRQQTQGTVLPSPHPLALALLGLVNSWTLSGLHCLLDQFEWTLLGGYPPSHPFMPSTPKSTAYWEGSFEIQSSPPEALGLERGQWALVPCSRASPTLGAKSKQGRTLGLSGSLLFLLPTF